MQLYDDAVAYDRFSMETFDRCDKNSILVRKRSFESTARPRELGRTAKAERRRISTRVENPKRNRRRSRWRIIEQQVSARHSQAAQIITADYNPIVLSSYTVGINTRYYIACFSFYGRLFARIAQTLQIRVFAYTRGIIIFRLWVYSSASSALRRKPEPTLHTAVRAATVLFYTHL